MSNLLVRKPDWPQRLNAYLAASVKTYNDIGFSWGEFDCCTFAFDWVEDACGVDLMADFRGTYATSAGASRALRKIGSTTLYQTVAERVGAPIHAAMAQRGDLVWRREDKCLGVVVTLGAQAQGVYLHTDRLGALPIKQFDEAFRI